MTFLVFSLYKTLYHVPFFDEINAWNIAQNFKPWEIFEITKHEGHLFIWYFLLMPFAQNDIGFPIAMQLINWTFCFGAVLLLWFKSPFNTITKIFITFSMPIQVFYTHARCYGIGIFLLFYACTLYKDRLKHPFLYTFLLILIGNTSVMALFLAFALGLCFIYDIYSGIKDHSITKKDFLIIFTIVMLGSILILSQLYNYTVPYYGHTTTSQVGTFYDYFIGKDGNLLKLLFAICHFGILAFAWDFFEKNKLPFIFLMVSNILIVITFLNIYRAATWHTGFLFITIIIALWMYLSEYKIFLNFQKTYLNIFCAMFILLTFCYDDYIYYGQHLTLAKDIQASSIMKNKKIFFYTTDSSVIGITHAIKDMGISYYDCLGNSINSKDFYIHQWDFPTINYKKMLEIMKTGETAYIFVNNLTINFNYKDQFNFETITYTKKHSDLKIELIEQNKYDIYIYKITKLE